MALYASVNPRSAETSHECIHPGTAKILNELIRIFGFKNQLFGSFSGVSQIKMIAVIAGI